MLHDPLTLKVEAKNEAYTFIDKYLRKLPKNADGGINEFANGFQDNDVDAIRHAYVSGVFTQMYSEDFANLCGLLQEYAPGAGGSSPNGPEQTNMDLWNNKIGRKYGKKAKNREELFLKLLEALKKGELIIDPTDSRKYRGSKMYKKVPKSLVVVIKESESGENRVYYDFNQRQFLNTADFVALIKEGQYPRYEVRKINGRETPVSKKDKSKANNLG